MFTEPPPPVDVSKLSEADRAALEDVRRRLVKILLVSGGIMGLGFLLVISVIIYKFVNQPPVAADFAGEIAVPTGATVLSAALDDDRLMLTIESGEGRSLLVVDPKTGKTIARIALKPTPPTN